MILQASAKIRKSARRDSNPSRLLLEKHDISSFFAKH
nr:MAG TPA: hypothetical protein [Caudoviricetes sp.]